MFVLPSLDPTEDGGPRAGAPALALGDNALDATNRRQSCAIDCGGAGEGAGHFRYVTTQLRGFDGSHRSTTAGLARDRLVVGDA